jgi:hypothetical protein
MLSKVPAELASRDNIPEASLRLAKEKLGCNALIRSCSAAFAIIFFVKIVNPW